MPPRKSRLRKREATPEPAEEEQPVDTTSTTVLNVEIEQEVVEPVQAERELEREPELERENDETHDEGADAQKKKKAKASKTPLKAAKSKAQPVAAADDAEHADTHVVDRALEAEFAEPLRAAVLSSPAQKAAPVRPSTRLIIKEMVLENFKSYAGTQLIGPFHKVRLRSTFLTASFFGFFLTASFFFFFFQFFSVLFCCRRPQRQRQVERDRCAAVCVWSAVEADPVGQGRRADSPI
jgi:hypothetical protein